MTVQHDDESRVRFRQLNLCRVLPGVSAAGVLSVVLHADTGWQAVVLGVGVVVAVVRLVRWTYGQVLRRVLPCLLVAGVVWVYGTLIAGSGSAFFGLLVVGSLVVPELRHRRRWAAAALVVFVGAVGSSRFLVSTDNVRIDLIRYVIVPVALTAVVVVWRFLNHGFYTVVEQLRESGKRDADLAVMRERVRFASDLHDIQGHTLHVVKLKTELACRTLRSDTCVAERELREIHALLTETISQTRALAYGQRHLNLQAELRNAKNLLSAAGARVTISGDGEPDPGWSDPLSQVLRETTTNILRHAQPCEVVIELGHSGLLIINDGADSSQRLELRGLAALRPRVAESGGELVVEREGNVFRTGVVYPDVLSSARRNPRISVGSNAMTAVVPPTEKGCDEKPCPADRIPTRDPAEETASVNAARKGS